MDRSGYTLGLLLLLAILGGCGSVLSKDALYGVNYEVDYAQLKASPESHLGKTLIVGGMIALVTAAIGHCSAFGGTCPRPGSSMNGDVFWGVAFGIAIAVGVPLWMRSPSWRGLARALLIAALVALLAGSVAMAGARG